MDAALYGARMMLVFERASPVVSMTAVSDLINGWPGGIIQAGRQGAFVTPLYHVNRMYAATPGRSRLRMAVEAQALGTGSARGASGTPAFDGVASRSTDGRTIVLKMVNSDPARIVEARIAIHGATIGPRARLELLTGEPGSRNSFATPDAIVPRASTIRAGNEMTLRLPPRSVSVLSLAAAPAH
jgi:alpha-L-arabinofuranosidase